MHKRPSPDVPVLLDQALSHQESGRTEDAEELYQRILWLDPHHAEAHHRLGLVAYAQGRRQEAVRHIQRAIAEDPTPPTYFKNLGMICQELGKPSQAIAAFRAAIERAPGSVKCWRRLADLLAVTGQADKARAAYERVLELGANDAALFGNLANICEHLNQLNDARNWANRGLEVDPGHVMSHYVLAKCERRAHEFEKAIARLERLPGDDDWKEVAFELGHLHDRLQDAGRAMHHFHRANRQAAGLFHESGADADRYLDKVDAYRRRFTWDWCSSWDLSTADESAECPVFVVGFPRTGTTLLDRTLRKHPGVRVIEERPIIASVARGQLPESLAAWTPEDREAIRREYWETAAQFVDRPDGALLIDKLPLNLVEAGTIARLFPKAKFLFCLRHPCDVCLSCYMQDFRPNDAMANFLSLGQTVDCYVAVMGLWEQFRNVLPLDVHTVRYEALIADPSRVVGEVVGCLGLEWDDALLDSSQRAAAGDSINTPSYHQVTETIYTHARGRWMRYRKWLEPHFFALEPFAERFGYGSLAETS